MSLGLRKAPEGWSTLRRCRVLVNLKAWLRFGFCLFLQEHFPVPVLLQSFRRDFGGEAIRGHVEFRGPKDAVEDEEALIGFDPV